MLIKVEQGLPALHSLRDAWLTLQHEAKASPFISYDWCAYQASLNSQPPVMVSAWMADKCVGILPLVVKPLSKRFSLPVLSHLCQRFTDYQMLLCDSAYPVADILGAMHGYIQRSEYQAYPLLLQYPDMALRDALLNLSGSAACHSWQQTFFRLQGAPVKAKVAREARRRKRKLEQTGSIEIHTQYGFDEALINWVLDQSAARHGANSLTDAQLREATLSLLAGFKDKLHLACIKKDGAFLAAHLGFVHSDYLYYYVPVTSDDERNLSPGIILLHEIISGMPDLALEAIDFLRGEESYKADWGNVFKDTSGVFIHGQYGINIKKRLLSKIWLSRNS